MTSDSTRVEIISLSLEEDIVAGRLRPGSVLRQQQLAERFGVSRMPVREALRRLAALDLVSFQPNRGVRVRTVSREDLRGAFLVRGALEALAAELAAAAISPTGERELLQAKADYEAISEVLCTRLQARDGSRELTGRWLRANDHFHDVIVELAGLPLLKSMAAGIRRVFFQSPLLWEGEEHVDRLLQAQVREHESVVAAILARSPAGAGELMRTHIVNTHALLDAVLARATKPGRKRRRSERGSAL